MTPQSDRRQEERPVGVRANQEAPRKRFRIEKIEERIAPDAHFNPHNSKMVGTGGTVGGPHGGSISGSFSLSNPTLCY
jgi:hypothetical protein